MPHFSDQYHNLTYPVAGGGPGLYNAQIGAIHSVASHFTVDDQPAIVTMPTGSGKTAVLMMTPYVLRAGRVLVVTPSQLVRGQISEDFAGLNTLREAGALPAACSLPKVLELDKRVESAAEWEALREYDVVVSTPNCASPGYLSIPAPPADLFDTVLIDEAHHSPAATWKGLLEAFPSARRVLFTATPFRRDRSEIEGRFVYSYPIARAFKDGIFGKIGYIQAEAAAGQSNDVAVALKAAEVFQGDRAAGKNHYLMVRTDRRARADDLSKIYAANTTLRLRVVHSGLSNRTVKDVLAKLESGALDGVICVNMMAEGFNFPRLKIAAIHAPHKSLEVTLQFVGRFARTNAPDIGDAKFIAVPSEIEVEGKRLFEEGKVWQDIIPDLSHGRIADELNVREALQRFQGEPEGDPSLGNLSLYSLHPRSHVKIYAVADAVDLRAAGVNVGGLEVRYSSANDDGSAAVVVTRSRGKPKWSSGADIIDTSHDLFIVFHDASTGLLFINSSRSVEGHYRAIADALSPGARLLATGEVGKVVKGVANKRIFSVGMRNALATTTGDSYKILAGSDPSGGITPADRRKYRQGHVFLTGEEGGERTTIGFSSGSKVWASGSHQIPELIDWCKALGQKIRSVGGAVTNSSLDSIPTGTVATVIPDHVVWAQWNRDAFDINTPVQVEYPKDDGTTFRGHIMDLELRIDSAHTDAGRIRFSVGGDGLSYGVEFTLDGFYSAVSGDPERVRMIRGQQNDGLIDYLNESYLEFYTGDGVVLSGNEVFGGGELGPPIELGQIETHDWPGTDITSEVSATAAGKSVHEEVRRLLLDGSANIILFDHGSGEMADFLTFHEDANSVRIAMYHCKGSDTATPGARVEDVYEVCGQAQKSVALALLPKLAKRIRQRRGKSQFVRGDLADLDALLVRARDKRSRFEIVLVQPGISKASLSEAMLENLGATNGHLLGSQAVLRVMGSA